MLYAYRTRLSKYDLDNDGYLDGNEIAMAFQAYEEKMQSIETGAVPFAFFPPEVQQNLTRYDESGDRKLDGMPVAPLSTQCASHFSCHSSVSCALIFSFSCEVPLVGIRATCKNELTSRVQIHHS